MILIISLVFILLASFFLQTGVFSMIPYFTSPNLLLVCTFTVAILRGQDTGMLFGAATGLLLDLTGGGVFGFYGMIYMYIGYGCGLLNQHISIDTPFVPFFVCMGCEVIYHFYIFLFRFVLRGRLGLPVYFQDIILPELVISTVFALFIYGLLHYLNDRLEAYEERRALIA